MNWFEELIFLPKWQIISVVGEMIFVELKTFFKYMRVYDMWLCAYANKNVLYTFVFRSKREKEKAIEWMNEIERILCPVYAYVSVLSSSYFDKG